MSNADFEDRFFFIHIPKTAGRYMWPLISGNFIRTRTVFWSEEDGQLFSQRNHLGLDAFGGHLPYTSRYLFPNDKRLFTYTILRDPVERTYSNYLHLTKIRPELDISLDDFIRSPYSPFHPDNVQTRMIGSSILIESGRDATRFSLSNFLSMSISGENDSIILKDAIRRLDELDCFGIKEHLEDSGRILSSKTGLTINVIEKRNMHCQHASSLSANQIGMIKSRNELDAILYQEAKRKFNDQ